MKRLILGILLGVTVLCHPIRTEAHETSVPKTIEVTYEEAQELLKIAWCEAGDQGIIGQQCVMSVIINRVNNPDFPNSIHDVIFQDNQFATAGMDKAVPTWETHYALAAIESGDVVPEIVAFETKTSNVLDVYFSEAFDYGAHTFYTCKH